MRKIKQSHNYDDPTGNAAVEATRRQRVDETLAAYVEYGHRHPGTANPLHLARYREQLGARRQAWLDAEARLSLSLENRDAAPTRPISEVGEYGLIILKQQLLELLRNREYSRRSVELHARCNPLDIDEDDVVAYWESLYPERVQAHREKVAAYHESRRVREAGYAE